MLSEGVLEGKFYQFMYGGVPFNHDDLLEFNPSQEQPIDLRNGYQSKELYEMLLTQFFKAYNDKSKHYVELKKEYRKLRLKLKNPLLLFTKKRKKMRKRYKALKSELEFKSVDLRNTRMAFIDSYEVI